MTSTEPPAGIALLCDHDGRVLEIMRDDLALSSQFEMGKPLPLLVDRASLPKALSFLIDLRAQGAAFQWEMNVPFRGEVITLHFAGASMGAQLVVVAGRSSDSVLDLYQDLVEMNADQATALRVALKACADHTEANPDVRYYEELSRLNNEMANLQRELAKKNAELEQLDQLKDQFLGIAAHDLRSPLSVIRGYAEFMLEDSSGQFGNEHLQFLRKILTSAEYMLQLVDDLLDVSTIEAGQLSLSLEPTDLVALIQRCVALNEILAERKGVVLELAHDAPLPRLVLDGARIEQALNNLLSNAIKYSYPGTRVTVRTSQGDGCATVSVVDRGPGIAAGQLERLFQWFGTPGTRGTAGERGTGLGLAIAKKIVTEHGGRIWVESKEGKGSAFHIALPVDRTELCTASSPQVAQPAADSRHNPEARE